MDTRPPEPGPFARELSYYALRTAARRLAIEYAQRATTGSVDNPALQTIGAIFDQVESSDAFDHAGLR